MRAWSYDFIGDSRAKLESLAMQEAQAAMTEDGVGLRKVLKFALKVCNQLMVEYDESRDDEVHKPEKTWKVLKVAARTCIHGFIFWSLEKFGREPCPA